MPDPNDVVIARLHAEVERLLQMRDDDEDHMIRQAQAHRMQIASLRQELASTRASHDLQTKATLAFREDWLREKARADALEAAKGSSAK